MRRAKVVKKQTTSEELPATNGGSNDAPSTNATNTDADADAAAIKPPPKNKARGKKAADATATTIVEEAEPEVVEKKPAGRGKRKAAEKIEVEVEAELPKSKGRTRKPTAEVSEEVAVPKAKITKSRAKKEDKTPAAEMPAEIKGRAKKEDKTPAAEEPAESKGRAKKEDKTTAAEEPAESEILAKKEKSEEEEPVKEAIKEPESKSRGRKKKEPEEEAAKPPVPVKGRAKKDAPETGTKSRAKKAEPDAVEAAATLATTKRIRGSKRLADTEIAEVLEADGDPDIPPTPQPEAEPVSKKRAKPAKSSDETVDVPVKKRGRKAASVEPSVEAAPAAANRKRGQRGVNDKPAEELNAPEPAPEIKPARGRKRQAAGAEVDVDAIAADAADGSRTSKTKKAATQKEVVADAAGSYDKSLFTSPTDKEFNFKISSWNVAGLRAWLKKDGLKFLDVEEPDIFCLQETKCTNDQLPDEMTRLPGYHPYWLCMPGGYAGVAIYSKIMPINVEYGIGNEKFDDVGRMITAEYEKFYLINVYVPNSGRKLVNLETRMSWEELFRANLQKLDARKPVVICGDMNVSHMEIDLSNPKANTRSAGFTKEEREKMTELLALGFVDTFRHFNPKRTGAYTFWTYMANARARNVGWRLDYCIVSERFLPRIVDNVMRSQCRGSDHCPITVFLNV